MVEQEEGSDLSESPYDVAAREGWEVVLPNEHDLFLDLDDDASEIHLALMLKTLSSNDIHLEEVKRTTSPGGNTHVYLCWPSPLTPMERIVLQAALGSDRKRELLSALRILLKLDRPPTVFFETARLTDMGLP